MSFLDFLTASLLRHFPDLETRLRDAAFESCAPHFSRHSGSSLLHPHLLPFLFPEFFFKHLFLQSLLPLPSMGLCIMAVMLLVLFPPPNSLLMEMVVVPRQFKHTKGLSGPQGVTAACRGHSGCMQMYPEGRREQTQNQFFNFPFQFASSSALAFQWMDPVRVSDTGLTLKSTGVKKS